MSHDQLQRFLFDGTDVRGEIVQLDATCREVLSRHGYPQPIARLLGELLAACTLLTATVKLDGTLGIEIRGSGPVRLLMAESNLGNHERAQHLRGLARFDQQAFDQAPDTSLSGLLGEGQVIITLEPHHGKRYQGIVPLEGDGIAACLETYFDQSEQLPTRLWLAATDHGAAGLLLQKLPGEQGSADSDAWTRLGHLAATLTKGELTHLELREILHRLFHEEQLRVFDPAPISFACTCSRARIGAALHQLGKQELHDILAEQGQIETTCQFCNTTYVFTPAEVEALIDNPDASRPTLH